MINHLTDESCPCQPTAIPVERDDGSIGWTYAHHEPGLTESQQAERAAAIVDAMDVVKRESDP